MPDQVANTLDNASQAPDSQNTQEPYKRIFTFANHILAGTRGLQYVKQENYDQRSAASHKRCDEELQLHLVRNDYGSKSRTLKQAEQDGDNPCTLLNYQLTGVGMVRHWTQEEFDIYKGNPSNGSVCDKWARNLNALMPKVGTILPPRQTQQSVPETVPYDAGTGTLSPDAWTNATQDLHGSTNRAQVSIANSFTPIDSAANTLASQSSSNTNINSSKDQLDPLRTMQTTWQLQTLLPLLPPRSTTPRSNDTFPTLPPQLSYTAHTLIHSNAPKSAVHRDFQSL